VNVADFSRALERSRERAEKRHLAAVESSYRRLIRRAGRDAAATLRAQTVTAASNWQPPPEGILFRAEPAGDLAAEELAGVHRRIVAAVAGPPLQRFGIAWDISHPLVDELLQLAAQRTGERLGEAVQPLLRKTIVDAYGEGLSVIDTASRIRAAIEEAAPWQAEMLARTDLNGLSNGGSVMAAKVAGVETKTWLTAHDERVREEHVAADGQTVPIDQPFQVCGEQLQYPGDPAGSDGCTANCRCSVVYGKPVGRTASARLKEETMSATQTAAAVAAPVRWQAILAVEGEPTEDGRMLAPGSLSWRELPIPLMVLTETGPGGHEGAQLGGRIDEIWRDGPLVMAAGDFDTGDVGVEAARLVSEQTLRGVSVDLAVREFEVRILGENGEVSDEEVEPAALLELGEDVQALYVVTDGVIGAATVCPFQAIGKATISIVGSGNSAWRIQRDGQFRILDATTGIATALETLAHVADMAARLDESEREKQERHDLYERSLADARRRAELETSEQQQKLLAEIQTLTARLATPERRGPRSLQVIRDSNGRPVGYQEGDGRIVRVIRDEAGVAVKYENGDRAVNVIRDETGRAVAYQEEQT
jgi:hypothetical protein